MEVTSARPWRVGRPPRHSQLPAHGTRRRMKCAALPKRGLLHGPRFATSRRYAAPSCAGRRRWSGRIGHKSLAVVLSTGVHEGRVLEEVGTAVRAPPQPPLTSASPASSPTTPCKSTRSWARGRACSRATPSLDPRAEIRSQGRTSIPGPYFDPRAEACSRVGRRPVSLTMVAVVAWCVVS